MEHRRDGTLAQSDRLTERDRRALVALEHSVRTFKVRGHWNRIHSRLIILWSARLTIIAGTLLALTSLVVIGAELSANPVVAVTGEVVLTAGALLVAHGVRLWWCWLQAKQAASQ
jgi:hypothetical protein